MKKIRIFELLGSFSKEELHDFGTQCSDTDHTSGRDYSLLIKALSEYYPEFNNKIISLEKLYKESYPGRNFNKRVIISRLSELTKLAEEFLVIKRIRTNSYRKNILLAEELVERKLFNQGKLLLNKLTQEITSKRIPGNEDLYSLDSYTMLLGSLYQQESNYKEVANILNDNLCIFFIFAVTRLLDMQSGLINIHDFHNYNTDKTTTLRLVRLVNYPSVIKELKRKNDPRALLIELFYYGFLASTGKHKEKAYKKLKKLFYSNTNNLDKQTRYYILSKLYHYAVSRINKGDYEFRKETYQILKTTITTDSASEHDGDYLSVFLYREFILSGLNQKKYSEIEEFITTYSEKLPPDQVEGMKHFATGKLHYFKKEFQKSLDHLLYANPNSLIVKIDAKTTILVLYYELERFEDAYLAADALKHFIKTNPGIVKLQKRSSLLFLQAFNKLLRLKFKPDSFRLEKLKKFIEGSPGINFPNWLREKVSKLSI